jgi:hypothetical protein
MYRIELRPGEEALFKSFDEFAKAVQNGVVSNHARIWHNASNKWLPIDFHPHFKRASAQRPASAPKPAVPDTESRVARAQKTRELLFIENEPRSPYAPPLKPTASAPASSPAAPEKVDPFSNDIELPPVEAPVPSVRPEVSVASKAAPVPASPVLFSHSPAPTPRHIEAVVAAAAPLAVHEPHAEPENEILIDISKRRSLPSFKLPRIRLRHIYAAAGLALVAAGGLMLSGREKPATADTAEPQPQPVASTSLAATSPASYEQPYGTPANPDPRALDLQPSGYMQVSDEVMPPAAPVDSGRATLPSAPRMSRVRAITSAPLTQQPDAMTPSALAARYRAAYDDAARALESQLRSAGLVNIFAESRLTSDNLGALRVAIAGATNFLRGYRARDEQLDTSYRDTAMQQFSKWSESETAAWAKAATLGETDASSTRADQLLSDISGMLGVLEAGAGSYKISNGVVTFESTAAAMEYEALRSKVVAALSNASTPMLATMKRVIGSTMPPATR